MQAPFHSLFKLRKLHKTDFSGIDALLASVSKVFNNSVSFPSDLETAALNGLRARIAALSNVLDGNGVRELHGFVSTYEATKPAVDPEVRQAAELIKLCSSTLEAVAAKLPSYLDAANNIAGDAAVKMARLGRSFNKDLSNLLRQKETIEAAAAVLAAENVGRRRAIR